MLNIALRPCKQRHKGRLLFMNSNGMIRHFCVENLPFLLRHDDLVVVNDTRTLPARLKGFRKRKSHHHNGDASIEGLFLKQEGFDVTMLLRPARKVQVGDWVSFAQNTLRGEVIERKNRGLFILRVSCDRRRLKSILNVYGLMPIPPYIGRQADQQDHHDYQTSYASHDGSVATPTAGLHFSSGMLEKVVRWIQKPLCRITLHVGLGTFLPVRNPQTHVMHEERYRVSAEVAMRINRARRKGGRIIAVGTTVLRTLESVSLKDGTVIPSSGWTNLFVKPGYRFRIVDALVTNFHLPNSTLLLLLKAFCGERAVTRVYHLARERKYRFYSYGDACFVERCRGNR